MVEKLKNPTFIRNVLTTVLVSLLGFGGGVVGQKYPTSSTKADNQALQETIDDINKQLRQIKREISDENFDYKNNLNDINNRLDTLENRINSFKRGR